MPASTAARTASNESASLTPDQPICFPPISAGPPIDHAPNVSGETISPVLPKGRLSSMSFIRQGGHFHVRYPKRGVCADRAEAEFSDGGDRTRDRLRIGELGAALAVDVDRAVGAVLGDPHVIQLPGFGAEVLAGDHQVQTG